MIFCFTLRFVSTPIVIRRASSGNLWKQTQTHSQILGRTWGILLKRWRRDYTSPRLYKVEDITRKLVISASLGSQELIEAEQKTREPA